MVCLVPTFRGSLVLPGRLYIRMADCEYFYFYGSCCSVLFVLPAPFLLGIFYANRPL